METTFAQALEEYNFNRPEAISAEAFEILCDLFPALAVEARFLLTNRDSTLIHSLF